jgi:hypothetical protein
MNRTEQDYLEMADHCKEVVAKKDKEIEYYKECMEEGEDALRNIEYSLKKIEFLLEYKKKSKDTDKHFVDLLFKEIRDMLRNSDRGRERLQCELDEEVLLFLENLS